MVVVLGTGDGGGVGGSVFVKVIVTILVLVTNIQYYCSGLGGSGCSSSSNDGDLHGSCGGGLCGSDVGSLGGRGGEGNKMSGNKMTMMTLIC